MYVACAKGLRRTTHETQHLCRREIDVAGASHGPRADAFLSDRVPVLLAMASCARCAPGLGGEVVATSSGLTLSQSRRPGTGGRRWQRQYPSDADQHGLSLALPPPRARVGSAATARASSRRTPVGSGPAPAALRGERRRRRGRPADKACSTEVVMGTSRGITQIRLGRRPQSRRSAARAPPPDRVMRPWPVHSLT